MLFDFDGTLVDSIELFIRSFTHTLTRHGGAVPPREEWLGRFGLPLGEQLGVYASSADEVTAMIATFRGHYDEIVESLLTVYPGVVSTLEALREWGVRVAIVTSKHRKGTLRALELVGLAHFFDLIVTPYDVPRGKPHPDQVVRALELLDVLPEEAIFLGDSPYDMAAGRAAGTHTAAALWGAFPRARIEAERPDFYLDSPEKLLELVGPRRYAPVQGFPNESQG